MLASYDCSTCANSFMRERGQANRTLKRSGGLIFCSSVCFGIHHRSNKTSEQKKAEKAVYDKAYRKENLADITAKKAAYHKATMDAGHKHCPGTVSFSLWHPNTNDFHLEVAINPKTDECFLVKQVYMRVVSCHKFSSLREGLLYVKHHHGIDNYGDESTVLEEQPLQVIQATRGAEGENHAK